MGREFFKMCDFDHVLNSFIILMSLVAAVGQIWNDRELEYSCTTVKEDAELPDRHLPEKSFNAKIRFLEPYECHFMNDLPKSESSDTKTENWCFAKDILGNFNNGTGTNESHLSAINNRTKIANAVKAPLTYVAVFFILQWLWDFVILGKLHGCVQHLFELTGEGNGCLL